MAITPRENLRGVIQRLEGAWSVLVRTSLLPQSFTRRKDPARESATSH